MRIGTPNVRSTLAINNLFIEAADYIHCSSDLLPDYKPVMQRCIEEGKSMVICPHGRQDADLLIDTGTWYFQPAEKHIEIMDSNGAGDSFFAGFPYGFLQNQSPEVCLEFGSICGALAVLDIALVNKNLSPELLFQIVQNGFYDMSSFTGKSICFKIKKQEQ